MKLYILFDSGSESGDGPAKSLGEQLKKPKLDFIFLPVSQSAGNWEFKSTPVVLKIYQPQNKMNKMQ